MYAHGYAHVYAHVYTHVYTQVYTHVCVYRLVYASLHSELVHDRPERGSFFWSVPTASAERYDRPEGGIGKVLTGRRL